MEIAKKKTAEEVKQDAVQYATLGALAGIAIAKLLPTAGQMGGGGEMLLASLLAQYGAPAAIGALVLGSITAADTEVNEYEQHTTGNSAEIINEL